MRINKYIASSGLVSRRKADELIKNGAVKVNGKVVKELGIDILQEDEVTVHGSKVYGEEKKVYYVLNKPLGYITTVSDDQGRLTIMDLLADIDARVFPVGRLDYNTSGLLIITNDGDLAYTLSHPKHEVYKTYKVRVKGIVSNEKVAKLRNGVDIGGFVTSRSKVNIIGGSSRSTILEIAIHEGKNRQVRKMFKAVGNPVQDLERTQIGDIRLGHLKEGHYRKLSREEVEYLKNLR